MTGIIQEYMEQIIAEVALSCGLNNWCYSVKNFDEKGQNYFGELIPIRLQGKEESRQVNLDLVIKFAPIDEKLRVSGALTGFFSKEIYVYSNVIREYVNLQKEISQCNFIAPICYFFRKEYCQEVIVLQDMRTEAYKPYLKLYFDLDHIKESLICLAQFHSLYFILKSKDQVRHNEITSTCPPLTQNNNTRFMDILQDRLYKALEKFKGTKHKGLFRSLLDNYVEFIESMSTSVNATCLCHADMWKENILFKYENDTPVSACLIDYQTARICSPAFDVLYVIATSTSSDLRHQNINHVLETYYNTFDKTLTEANLISDEVYAKKMFYSDLKKVGPGVLIIANTAIWLSCGLQQEGNVRSKIVLTTEEEKEEAVNRYKANIENIVVDFDKLGYLDIVYKVKN